MPRRPAQPARQPPGMPTDLTVLYEDNHLLAVAKPAGLLTQAARPGDDNLVDRARAYLKWKYDKPGNVFVGLVHRLDRNVSGVCLLARTSKAASRLSAAFAGRRVRKGYLAVVWGEAPREATLEDRLAPRAHRRPGERGVERSPRGKVARLAFRRLGVARGRSALAVALFTGRKHQIRAQLAGAGLPLVGDPLYGRPEPRGPLRRPALHAARLVLEHPVRHAPLLLEAPLPADVREAFAILGWDDDPAWEHIPGWAPS